MVRENGKGTSEEVPPTEKIVQETVEEARTVLPGIQALFGFQLIATFNERFQQLNEIERVAHYVALVLVSISIALIMTPAAYHRLAEQFTVSRFFVRFASTMIAAAMVPLMLALPLEVYLVGRAIIGSMWGSLAIAVGLLLLTAGLWFAFPLAMRLRDAR